MTKEFTITEKANLLANRVQGLKVKSKKIQIVEGLAMVEINEISYQVQMVFESIPSKFVKENEIVVRQPKNKIKLKK